MTRSDLQVGNIIRFKEYSNNKRNNERIVRVNNLNLVTIDGKGVRRDRTPDPKDFILVKRNQKRLF